MSEQSGEFTQNPRFGEQQLTISPDVPIRHFHPLLHEIIWQSQRKRNHNSDTKQL
jgi:hypothetical protein